MATNLPSCFSIQFLEQLLKFLVNFTLLKYIKSQRNYGFLIAKELIFGFQILDLKDHFSASLKELQKKYVFVPADKAANSIILVCNRYYLEVICKELGLWQVTTSSGTYIPETMDTIEISGNNISYMKISLTFKEDNLSDKFPSFYWTPKLHKTPYKHRSIASSFDCTTKPLYSSPVSYLSSKRNFQTCHQSYTVAQVSSKCGF